jgi:hypothetical protein
MSVGGLSTADQCSLWSCGMPDVRTVTFSRMRSSGTASIIFTFTEGHRGAAYFYQLVYSSLYLNPNYMFQQTVSTQAVYISTSQHTNYTVLLNSLFTITISFLHFQLHTTLMHSPHVPCSRPSHTLCPVSTAHKNNSPCVVQSCRFTELLNVVRNVWQYQ